MSRSYPLVSVLTPTWNRSTYLQRVWQGLRDQTYPNFEWIVANDGSSDDTDVVVRSLADRGKFPVILISASTRIGKARMDNEAVRAARGELVIWNDSDDYLLPGCLARLVECWLSIPPDERPSYVAVSALCATREGVSLNTLPSESAYDSSWNGMAENEQIKGDMVHLIQARLLKEHKFPEVDFVVPESVVWSVLGEHKVRVLPETLQVKEYRAPFAISFSAIQQYCRGRAYALATSEAATRHYLRPLKSRIWRLITFIRYSVHGELSAREQRKLWHGCRTSLWVALYPCGWILAAKDRVRGNVRYTHREFSAAQRTVSIKVEELPQARLGSSKEKWRSTKP